MSFRLKLFSLLEFGKNILEQMEIGDAFLKKNNENYPMGKT